MKILDIIKTANHNLLRAKLRTLLTILAIFVGGFTLTLTTALNTGASEYLDRQLGNISKPGVFQVVAKTDFNPLQSDGVKEYDPNARQTSMNEILESFTQQDIDKLAKVDGVDSAEPLYNTGAEYITRGDDSKKYQVSQVTQNIDLNLDLAAGSLITDNDKQSIILSEDYISPLGFNDPQDAVGKKVILAYRDIRQQPKQIELTVVGVMKKTFVTANQLFVSFDVAQKIAEAQGQTDKFFGGWVRFADVNDQTDENELKQRLESAGNYTAMSMKERVGTVTSIVGAVTAALNVVGIIALLAASFGIINTLLMSVYERTQEIGLMKALGMHRSTVFGIFATEAVLVGFWGSLIACLVAYLVSMGVNQFASDTFLKDFEGFQLLVVSPANIAFVMGLIMLIAFLAGTFPALKASRLNPIEALRSE